MLQLIDRPDLGGRIDKLLDRQTNYEWLWHPKDYDSSQKRSLTVGVFQSYGGWRGHYVLVLEPCTTIPYDLEVACRNGTAALLKPPKTARVLLP